VRPKRARLQQTVWTTRRTAGATDRPLPSPLLPIYKIAGPRAAAIGRRCARNTISMKGKRRLERTQQNNGTIAITGNALIQPHRVSHARKRLHRGTAVCRIELPRLISIGRPAMVCRPVRLLFTGTPSSVNQCSLPCQSGTWQHYCAAQVNAEETGVALFCTRLCTGAQSQRTRLAWRVAVRRSREQVSTTLHLLQLPLPTALTHTHTATSYTPLQLSSHAPPIR